jgi:hypothetical protein
VGAVAVATGAAEAATSAADAAGTPVAGVVWAIG